MEGALDWLGEMAEHFDIVVQSTRAATPAGCEAIRAWLHSNGFTATWDSHVTVTDRKLPCLALPRRPRLALRGSRDVPDGARHPRSPAVEQTTGNLAERTDPVYSLPVIPTQADSPKSPEAGQLAALPGERTWRRPWQAPFLNSLSHVPDVSSACRTARIARTTAYDMRDADQAFRDAWDEALELARDKIEHVAHNWATIGLPVKTVRTHTKRTTDKNGNLVTETTETVETESAERSATLMIFWLKAHYPDRYRWADRIEATGAEGGPIRISSLDALDQQIEKLEQELRLRARESGESVPAE